MRVLVIEHDDRVANSLMNTLSTHGHRLKRCRPDINALATHRDADLVLVGDNHSDPRGLDLLRTLRRISDAPVLLLGGRHPRRSPTEALRELLATAGTVAAASARQKAPASAVVTVGDLTVNLRARSVQVASREVALTAKEFDILAVLARRAGAATSRGHIMDEVWGERAEGISHSLDVHLTALRAKLKRPALLRTIRGYGYRLG